MLKLDHPQLKSLACAGFLATVLTAVPEDASAGFQQWLTHFRSEAKNKGVDEAILDKAFQGVSPSEKVLKLDRKQWKGGGSFRNYRKRIVNQRRIRKGRELLSVHRPMLEEVGRAYGVQPRFIVALWGIETNYGTHTGDFPLFQSLATLAYDGRRGPFFRSELLHALKIVQNGHISIPEFKGSWAGAMGQTQFMPSSFHRYAQDFDKDGRKDIWGTHADIFASAANYLKHAGWDNSITWGRRVKLPSTFNLKLANLKVVRPIAKWQKLGVRRADGRSLPMARPHLMASIVLPDGKRETAYMVYGNYRAIMRWNKSKFFATSVGLLSDAIARPAPATMAQR